MVYKVDLPIFGDYLEYNIEGSEFRCQYVKINDDKMCQLVRKR